MKTSQYLFIIVLNGDRLYLTVRVTSLCSICIISLLLRLGVGNGIIYVLDRSELRKYWHFAMNYDQPNTMPQRYDKYQFNIETRETDKIL